MKIKITIILTFLSFILLKAQYNNTTESVAVNPYWEKGDQFFYEQNEKEYQVKNGDTIIKKNKRFDLNLTVTDQDSTSYTIEWITQPDLSQIPPALLEEFKTKIGNQRFIYKTNQMGQFQELLNFDEIVAYNKNIIEFMGDQIPNKNNKKAFKMALEKVFGNDEVTTQLIASKINTFHLFYGKLISKTKPEKKRFESINPVTKNKIIYNQSIQLEEYNPEDQVYTLYSETSPEEENLIGEIKSTLETIISKEAKEMEQIQNLDYISKVFQATHNSGVILYQMKRDFIEVDNQETIKELEFILK